MIQYHIAKTVMAMAPAPEGAPQEGHTLIMMVFYGALFAVFYFMLIRPQMRRNKEMRALQESLKKGDAVLTTGGIYGVVAKVKDEVVTVEIAEGVKVKMQRSAILEKLSEGAAPGKDNE